jgi:hypothetical protein
LGSEGDDIIYVELHGDLFLWVDALLDVSMTSLKCAIIREQVALLPTPEQNFASVFVCQMLSNCYRDIQIFRYSPSSRVLHVFANDALQIVITPDGKWRFLDETEL